MSKDSNIQYSNAGNIFLGVLAIATVRDFIEITLRGRGLIDSLNPLDSLKTYFLHFNSFYFLVFVGLSLTLYLFIRKRSSISDCFKTGALAMLLIWVAPLYDYFAYGHFDMAYPSDPLFVVCNLHHIADPSFNYEGLSKGMRLEIMLAGIGAGAYIYYKTKKIIRSVCGGICISLNCLFIGLFIPFLTQLYEYGLNFGYHKLYNSTLLHQGFIVHGTGCKIALFYILLCMILLSLAYFLRNPKRFTAITRNMRWARSFHYVLLFTAGLVFVYNNPPVHEPFYPGQFEYFTTIWNHPIDLFGILMAAIAIFLSFQSAVIFNDIYDYDIDIVCNTNRPLVTNAISFPENLLIARIFAVLALTIAFCISETFFFLIIIYHFLAYLYSAPPFRLRKYFLFSNLELATIFLITFHAGACVLFQEYRFDIIPTNITFGLLICYALVLTTKDFKDFEGDKKSHIQTIFTLLGQKRGNLITGVIVCSVILLVPFILRLPQLIVFSITICLLFIISIKLIKKQNVKENMVSLLYFTYMLVTFYTLVFQHRPQTL